MPRGALLVLLMVLAAGCLGADEAGPEEAVDPLAAPPSAAPTTTAAAGQTPTAPTATQASGEDAAPPAVVETPYSWSDTLKAAACVPAGVGSCISFGPLAFTGWYDELQGVGNLSHARLTLTWTASSPTTERMRLVLVVASPEDCEGCWSGEAVGEPVIGTSPLSMEITDVPRLEAGQFYVVGARPAATLEGPVVAYLYTDQPFEVAGTLGVIQ